jgi:ribokinase
MRAAVVGHVEWITFVPVDHVPVAGEIVPAGVPWEDAGGGGAVAAAELARLGAQVTFFTALGDDEHGTRSRARLEALGVTVRPAIRTGQAQRRGITLLDADGERTIIVIGPRQVPMAADDLPWGELAEMDAVYFTGGDAGALRAARAAKAVVATTRARETLVEAGVELDALVYSDRDPSEAIDLASLAKPPRATVRTLGADGGRWVAGTEEGHWAVAPLPGPRGDAYGCGDCFAAGVTYGLGARQSIGEAVQTGARSGADCLTRRGPYPASARSLSSGA